MDEFGPQKVFLYFTVLHSIILRENPFLVGGFNPSKKYARQIGSFPQIGLKITDL